MTQPETGIFTLVLHAANGPKIVAQGSESACMRHIKDSKAQREDLIVSNRADEVRRRETKLAAREAAFEAEVQVYNDFVAADRDVFRQLTELQVQNAALKERLDRYEARNTDPNERPSPPGYPDDDGELQAPEIDPNMPRSPAAVED